MGGGRSESLNLRAKQHDKSEIPGQEFTNPADSYQMGIVSEMSCQSEA